jgi:1-acyl-sn-glycerol-3-phosphate acyltransferase/ribosomal protein S27AE
VKGKERFHLWVWRFLWFVALPVVRGLFKYRCIGAAAKRASSAKFAGYQEGIPALVVSNHTTDLDPLFVGCSFPGHLYFVASEHVFRMGFASALIRFFFSPVVFSKGSIDVRALRDILDRLRKGARVCLFAEGNRSFSGKTGKIDESTGKLVRLSGAALITYRLRGGYFSAPRWGRKMRRGPVWGEPVGFYPPETLKSMRAAEITALICRDIYEDAYETMRENPRPYRGKGLAENLETALYLCPRCGGIGTLRSREDRLYCGCGLTVRYDEYGALHPAIGDGEPVEGEKVFTTVRDWWFWQDKAVEKIAAAAGREPVCFDEGESLFEIRTDSEVRFLDQGRLSLGRGGLCCGETRFPLGDIPELAITGQRTLIFSARGKRYELKNDKPRSAAKYQRIFELLVRDSSENPVVFFRDGDIEGPLVTGPVKKGNVL